MILLKNIHGSLESHDMEERRDAEGIQRASTLGIIRETLEGTKRLRAEMLVTTRDTTRHTQKYSVES